VKRVEIGSEKRINKTPHNDDDDAAADDDDDEHNGTSPF
jgi:hypothetical protein